jgi:hypothetical protein
MSIVKNNGKETIIEDRHHQIIDVSSIVAIELSFGLDEYI